MSYRLVERAPNDDLVEISSVQHLRVPQWLRDLPVLRFPNERIANAAAHAVEKATGHWVYPVATDRRKRV